jgi:hypothetical protein
VGGDEGALALPAHEVVLLRQFVDRLAHRALADLEARGQVDLAGDHLAGPPFAGLQPRQQQCLDLLVQRAERRRRTAASSGAVGGVGARAASAPLSRTCVLHKT